MNSPPLPIEVVELIIEDFISEHARKIPTLWPPIFLPQWYLTPLLRVCRSWHAVSEKYLYQTVAVGNHFHNLTPVIKGESFYARRTRLRNLQMTQPRRNGYKIAEDLLATLAMNSRLASLVKTLWLGLEAVDDPGQSEPALDRIYRKWTQTNISIIRLCPNVNEVEIRGFATGKRVSLLSVLKEKSLASFFISPRNLSGGSHSRLYSKHLFDLMQKWPNLRSITAHYVDQEPRPTINASQVVSRCPELREVIFKGFVLCHDELKVLCTMCSGVTRFEISACGHDYKSLDALCDCLRAWSSTLEYFSLCMEPRNQPSYQPLCQALSSLNGLRELVLLNMRLDMDALSELPRLEHIRSNRDVNDADLMRLSRCLRDTKKFLLLKSMIIAVYPFSNNAEGRKEVEESCIDRTITVIFDWVDKRNLPFLP